VSNATLQPTVSVVLPARNAARTLVAQLCALSSQELSEPWEVIVVDNGSTDGTAEILARWADRLPWMNVVICAQRGTNSARNVGVRAARAERILLCDSDDVDTPGWVRELSRALDDWDLVGGVTETAMLNAPPVQFSRANPVSDTLRNAFGAMSYAIGANMGFRREVFDEVGGFDEAFVLGADEIDFCWRAQYAGFRLGFAPEAVVQYRLKSRPTDAMRQAYVFARGDAQLYAKHRGLGRLPQPSAGKQMRAAGRRLRPLARVGRIAKPEQRLRYARDLGRVLGLTAGFVRYRVVP
jgi:glycosyltransferase involved in cell wall biosynthesis